MIEPSPSFWLAAKCAFIVGLLGGGRAFPSPDIATFIVAVAGACYTVYKGVLGMRERSYIVLGE